MLNKMERWFLLDDGAAPAAWNMAVDELLLGMVDGERTAPILRLYSFDPPAITVGYHQDPFSVLDMRAAGRDKIDVARRFTGGRALLHADELTYSLMARTDRKPFDSPLHDAHRGISRALVRALRSLGVDATISGGRHGSSGPGSSRPCIDSVSRHEVTVGGRKVIASAQRRTRSALLQHGSIFLSSASARIAGYILGGSPPLNDRVAGISGEGRGAAVDAAALKRAIVDSFTSVYGISFERLRLSPVQRAMAERRSGEKRDEVFGARDREAAI